MEHPLITVITATYNSGQTLEDSIKSVISQTYKNIEYIIIDGGSKDNTIDIIKKYENNVSHWITESDEGVYDAWNKGLKLATGRWITFIGSDDEFYSDAIQNYIDFITHSEVNYDFVSSRVHILNENKKIIRVLGWPWEWERSRKVFTIAHPGSFHSREMFVRTGEFNTNYKICGDYDLLLRCGSELKAGYLDKITLKMALGGLSDSSKVLKESYRVIRTSGKVGRVSAALVLSKQYFKLFVRKSLFKFGIYPYKK